MFLTFYQSASYDCADFILRTTSSDYCKLINWSDFGLNPYCAPFHLIIEDEVMKTICIKTKLKKELIKEVRIWFQTLKDRIDETLESLENEGVFVESAFLDKQGDDLYLIYYVRAKDIPYMYEVFNKSTLAIADYYKNCWKEYCQEREVLEVLLDVDRLESLNICK